ncbi:MAG: hypothetical protein E7673_01910 [Ruminococcaceae bacterium]|nr:hypothetical protein [Oscillospiraceae bacterium]
MRILFIGNSYTFFNDMPKLLEELAKANGKELTADSVTKGGRHLYSNLNEGDEYAEKIKALSGKYRYDTLFLQEQSFLAIVDYDKFLYGVENLKDIVGAKKTILYATWGRKTGSEKLTELGLTSEEMTNELTKAYISAAQKTGAEVSHVGRAFLKISKALPEIDLYNPDLSHPSYIGSAVAAICHYNALFGEMPKALDCFNLGAISANDLIGAISEALSEG